MNISDLEERGFEVQSENHARAILAKDFPEELGELCEALSKMQIADVELIQGGGGQAKSTQRLGRELTVRGWKKDNIEIKKTVDGKEREAMTHEIDHVRRSAKGTIALEIEWNNKDPFFDRDLENFQRLHSEGAISVGAVITRGASLQDGMPQIILDCAKNNGVQGFEDLNKFGLELTTRQRNEVMKKKGRFDIEEWSRVFARDKFGQSTTHWDKLQDRIRRGVGNPCPLLLIGIPKSVISQDMVT